MKLEDVFQDHGMKHVKEGEHRHARQGWIGVDCPYCGSIGKYHLGFNPISFSASCWKCGRKNFGHALGMVLGVSTGAAWHIGQKLNRHKGDSLEKKIRQAKCQFPKKITPMMKQHRKYLKQRGFDPEEIITKWDLCSIGVSAKYAWTIWIPVKYQGRVVTWTTRTIGEKHGKYQHASPEMEEMPINDVLYGWDYVQDVAIIVEGPSDVWRIGYGAVASFGLNLSHSQRSLLSELRRVVVCFDNEPDAQRRARNFCTEISESTTVSEVINVCLEADDPGEAKKEEIEDLRVYLH